MLANGSWSDEESGGGNALTMLHVVAILIFIYFWPCFLFVSMHRFSPVAASEGSFLAVVLRYLVVVASLVVEQGL